MSAVTDPPASVIAAVAQPAPPGVPYQDPKLTPGAVFVSVTAAQVCVPGYSSSVRDVSEAEKRAVYAEYHEADVPGADEVDHLISLELGGSNVIQNLWPEPYAGTYGAHAKDKVEDYLHDQVCSGRMTLAAAQVAISTRWWAFLTEAGGPALPGAPTTTLIPPTQPAVSQAPPARAPPSSTVAGPPPGATARCNDGSYSYSAHHQGSCSHHGGVAELYQ
jgi:hypothetical protein